MSNATKTKIEWLTGNGQKASVEIVLETAKTLNADGHIVDVSCCDLSVVAAIDGNEVGFGEPIKIAHPVAVAMIGKLGIKQKEYDKIISALTEIKRHPQWVSKIAREEQALKDEAEYEEHCRKMAVIIGE